MKKGKREIFVVGDRVLIVPDIGDDRSSSGLYLPKWAVEKESIQAGRIVELGPGIPMPTPNDIEDEPWRERDISRNDSDMQAQIGDYAIFLRKAAVEVKFDNELFLLVPHSALLLLVRDND